LNKNELLITSFQENKLDQSIKLDPIIIKHIKNLTETLNSLEKSNEINTNKKYIIPKLNLYKKNESESESEKEEEEEEEKIIHTNRSNTSAYEHIFKSLNNINKIIDNATSDRKNIRESIIDKREENWDNLEPSLMNNNHNNSTVTFNNEENDLENILKDYNFQLNLLKERENEKMEQSISISSNFFSIIDKKNN
jgi:organic radical activating enzyme